MDTVCGIGHNHLCGSLSASISALKGGGYSTKVQMTTTKEAKFLGIFSGKKHKAAYESVAA